MRAIIYIYVLTFLCSFVTASHIFQPAARANEAQHHICKAGMNIGQAQARAELYGHANGGVIPPAQLTAIEANLTTASAEITTAEGLFVEPFVAYRAEHGMPANELSEIARYPEFTAGWSYQHRTAYIRTIYGMYHRGLAITYVSPRDDDLDGFRQLPNCDSTIFQFCYYYGMATIASEVGGDYARGGQTEANGSFRRTVQTGLKIAMDRGVVPGDPGHLPDDGITKKVCCTFGTPKTWEGVGLSVFQWNSPTSLYVMNSVPILSIIGNAVELDPICEPEQGICASSRVHMVIKWAAVTYSKKTGQWIRSWNAPAKEKAEKKALSECKAKYPDCKILGSFRSCSALAKASDNAATLSWRDALSEAKTAAMKGCNAATTTGDCQIDMTLCADGTNRWKRQISCEHQGPFENCLTRYGGDYRKFWLSSPDPVLCKRQCDREDRCRAWTYVQPGRQGPQARCWLKSTVPPISPNPYCVSGLKGAGN